MDLLDIRFEQQSSTIAAFANVNLLNLASRNERVRDVLCRSVVINDGIGVDIASRFLFGSPFPENLNGTDFIPRYLQTTRHHYRIFLLGGRPSVAKRANEYFAKQYPRHCIVGCHHGYFSAADSVKIIDMIKASNAEIILVGMGNPQQELWIADNLQATGCRLAFGVGALFDFVTGNARRAPHWIRADPNGVALSPFSRAPAPMAAVFDWQPSFYLSSSSPTAFGQNTGLSVYSCETSFFWLSLLRQREILYQIALPATHLRRCGRFVTPVQVFDLTHVYDATIPAQRRVT